MNSKLYDTLKWIALIALPAFATFYLAFGNLWNLPASDKVSTSVMLVDALLGALLQIKSSQYNNNEENFDGTIDADGVHEDTGLPNLKMNINSLPQELLSKKVVRFKVRDPQPAPKPGENAA